jgi:hypothetical protein
VLDVQCYAVHGRHSLATTVCVISEHGALTVKYKLDASREVQSTAYRAVYCAVLLLSSHICV